MSVKVMASVWENSPQKENKLLALLAIADNANDDGWAYPTQATLAKKCRVQRRSMQKILDDLEALDEIVIYNRVDPIRPLQHFSNVYHLPKYGTANAPHPTELRGQIKPRGSVQKDTTGGDVPGDMGGDVQKDTTLTYGDTSGDVQKDTRVTYGGTHELIQELSMNKEKEKIEPPSDPEERRQLAQQLFDQAVESHNANTGSHWKTDEEIAVEIEAALTKYPDQRKAFLTP